MDFEKATRDTSHVSEPANEPANGFEGWERVGTFSSYHLYARENLRRIVDPDTGAIVAQYIMNEKEPESPK